MGNNKRVFIQHRVSAPPPFRPEKSATSLWIMHYTSCTVQCIAYAAYIIMIMLLYMHAGHFLAN